MSFDRALGFVLAAEGGYADNPADPGGKTLTGVTQRTYDNWRTGQGLPTRDVQQLTVIEQRRIYAQAWEDGHCDELPRLFALTFYDAIVNHGPTTATKLLQRVVGSAVDGVIGPHTLEGVKAMLLLPNGEDRLIGEYIEARRALYRALADDPEKKRFLAGWLSRMLRLQGELTAWEIAP